MLLRAIFLCAAIAVLGETMLEAAAALAVASFHRQGVSAAVEAFGDAEERAQSAIASAVAQESSPSPPAPAPTCSLATSSGCALSTSESIAFSTPSPAPCPSDGCAAYAQENDAVLEGRIDASIAVSVATSSGEIVASRSGTIVFRTLRLAPYALPAGAMDATLDDSESGTGSPNTLIDVVYQNVISGAVMPANVWSGTSATTPAASAWSP